MLFQLLGIAVSFCGKVRVILPVGAGVGGGVEVGVGGSGVGVGGSGVGVGGNGVGVKVGVVLGSNSLSAVGLIVGV
jgi:hypothetical protein